jgi:hypothetical protein
MKNRTLGLAVAVAVEIAAITAAGGLASPAKQSDAKPLPAGPECITTTVLRITTRLTSQDSETGKESQVPGSGSQIFMRGRLPDKYGGWLEPTVVFYQEAAENKLIARERAGDRVQVCAIGFPGTDDAECNPKTDRRGRELRVYDYARRFAYEGPNSEHMCGGA